MHGAYVFLKTACIKNHLSANIKNGYIFYV